MFGKVFLNPQMRSVHVADCCRISIHWFIGRHISRIPKRPRWKTMPRSPLMAFRLHFPRGWDADRDRMPLFSTTFAETHCIFTFRCGIKSIKVTFEPTSDVPLEAMLQTDTTLFCLWNISRLIAKWCLMGLPKGGRLSADLSCYLEK